MHKVGRLALFFFISLMVLGVLISVFFPVVVSAEKVAQPYTPIRYSTDSKKVIFLYAKEEQPATTLPRRIDVFSQILSSRWNIEVRIEDVFNTTIDRNDLSAFDTVFVFNESNQELPKYLRDEIDYGWSNLKEVVWFNASGGEIIPTLRALNQTIYQVSDPNVKTLNYKDVDFTDENVSLLFPQLNLSGLKLSDDIIPIGNLKTTGLDQPLALEIDYRNVDHLVLPVSLPGYWSLNHSIVLLDIMHRVLGSQPEAPKTALVRLEDVNAFTYQGTDSLTGVSEFLIASDIPFSIAYIERYINQAAGVDIKSEQRLDFMFELGEILKSGKATLVQHGFTHQFDQSVTGIGSEFNFGGETVPAHDRSFIDSEINPSDPTEVPIETYTTERIMAAKNAMQSNGLPVPDIWETPHYESSYVVNEILDQHYPLRYENHIEIGFLPFPVNIDGIVYLPETLSFIHHDWQDEFVQFKERYERFSVFENGTASFFWHPWRNKNEIQQLISYIENKGHTFVGPYDLLEIDSSVENSADSYAAYINSNRFTARYLYIVGVVISIYIFFIIGLILFLRKLILFDNYLYHVRRFNIDLEEVKFTSRLYQKPLPKFAIFVPARNEGYVIANTIRQLESIDYPKNCYKIVIIVDAREREDDVEIYTINEAKREAKRIKKKYRENLVQILEVPKSYSGDFGSRKRTYEKSTKGRALNYALQCGKWDDIDLVGVVDADGRLNENVLKEAALHRIRSNSMMMQGPVFQVSNLSKVSIIGAFAGIELAMHHLTELPYRMKFRKKVQFLAGTNYYIDKNAIVAVNGWNKDALVEDAELALRIYTDAGIQSQWLNSYELEQTPESFRVYRKQRERWARGQLQLVGAIMNSGLPKADKIGFIRKIYIAQFRFIFELFVLITAYYIMFSGIAAGLLNSIAFISFPLIVGAFFMWESYGYAFRRLSRYSYQKISWLEIIIKSILMFFLFPVFIAVQFIPRIDALINFYRGKDSEWYKTERTKEDLIKVKT